MAPGKSWGTVASLLRYVPLGLYACFAIRREDKLQALYWPSRWCWRSGRWMRGLRSLTGWSLAGHAEPERITGIFGATNPKLGPSLAVLSPFALWAAQRAGARRACCWRSYSCWRPVLMSGSRASWLVLCAGGVGFRLAHRADRRCVSPPSSGGLAVALLLAGGLAWKTSERFQLRMDRTLHALSGPQQSLDTALTGRLDIWRTSVAMFEAHPINGVGVRAYRYAYPGVCPARMITSWCRTRPAVWARAPAMPISGCWKC